MYIVTDSKIEFDEDVENEEMAEFDFNNDMLQNVAKMNRCTGLECSEEMSDFSLSEDENDEPLHYSEEYIDSKSESDTVNSYLSDMSINMSEASSSTATSLAWMKTTKKMSQKSKPKAVEEGIKIFCPYEKKITISTLLPISQYDPEAEATMMKRLSEQTIFYIYLFR